ncbi:MAG: hypothetical protein ACI8P9_003027 [Parasphingorhabdus sp.]
MLNQYSRLYFKLKIRSKFRNRRKQSGLQPGDINNYAYRVFSQHREDGIIDHLLQQVPDRTGKFIEFGFSPSQCNCINLLINYKYQGLFMDSNASNCEIAEGVLPRFNIPGTMIQQAFLDLTNINPLISKANLGDTVDVLSIDVDGNDYWFWESIETDANVVVVEYNGSFGAERAISVPYNAEFDRYKAHSSGFYHGASLKALACLGEQKGMALVGTDVSGVNAFFIKRKFLSANLLEMDVSQAFRPNRGRTKYKKLSQPEQFACIEHLPYTEIS